MLVAGTAVASEPTFETLQSLMERDDLKTVESLLAALPGDYRSHFSLMFASRSLQQASFTDPRVVLFGTDAKLLITFNGNPSQRGYETLETAQFNESTNRFEFREIVFPERADSGSVQISAVNPERCLQCHGEPARPIWDSPPLWPGAYGERYGSNLSALERAGLIRFLNEQPSHPRYRQLLGVTRFAYRGTYVPDARGQYDGIRREPPNAELSALLNALNMRMIAAELKAADGYTRYRYALLGAAEGNCGVLEDFLPSTQQARVETGLMEFRESSESANQRELQSKAQRTRADTAIPLPLTEFIRRPTELIDLRYIAEAGLGVPTLNWTLALEKSTYDFTTPDTGTAALATLLRADLTAADPLLSELHGQREYSADDRYCRYLQRRSRESLTSETVILAHPATAGSSEQEALIRSPELLLQRCAACHGAGAAPPVPFDRPDQLASWLHKPARHGELIDEILFRIAPEAGSQRMPPSIVLTPTEREVISKFLLDLAYSSR
jgi:hypothetical protein